MPTVRPIQSDDLTALGDLLDDVFRRSRGITHQHILTDFPLVFSPSNFRNCRVIEEEGRIVSHAALWQRFLIVENCQEGRFEDPVRLKVGVIVVVATHPDFRKRGHAAAIMRDLQSTMHEHEYDLGVLWTGVPDFYRKLGWQKVVPRGSIVSIDSASVSSPLASDFEIERYNPARHFEQIIALHEQETVRFERTPDEFRLLLGLPKVHVWIATEVSQVAAYLVHGEAVNKLGFIEYGGQLEAISAIANHIVCNQPTAKATSMLVYHVRSDLAEWAEAIGLRRKPLEGSKGAGHEMIYVVQPRRLSVWVRDQLFVWGLDHA